MDIYISYANALTSLGYGNDLWDSLVSNQIGLTPLHMLYPNIIENRDKNSTYDVGILSSITSQEQRVDKLFELIDKTIMSENITKCDLIIGASSLGDLTGENSGVPEHSLKNYLKTKKLSHLDSFLVSSACSSGTDALIMASLLVSNGVVNNVGVLAFDTLEKGKILQHIALQTQSKYRIRPFDSHRSGTSFGEGAAFVIVSNTKGLEKLKVQPLVKIGGTGMSCDAYDITNPEPSGKWQAQALNMAFKNNNYKDRLGYINLHGTGTRNNDLVESKILNMVFTNKLNKILLSSTKGALGHSLGATGLVEAVITIWSIKNKICPGTMGLDIIDNELNLNILRKAKPCKNLEVAMSVTFGFGGTNSAIIFEDIK